MNAADPAAPRAPGLLHRWFVQYNPMYLLSAALVLAGIWLLLREAANEGSPLGQLGVAGLAELYAFMLIGGAGFLVRIDARRPAVMLALLAVLYQADLTLHVETSAYLGWLGRVAAAGWLAIFAGKLRLLIWALRLRVSRAAWLVPLFGAAGLALLPQLLRDATPGARWALIAGWVFSAGAAGLWTRREVHGDVELGVRARRSLLATWALWGALGAAHALYWCHMHRVSALAVAVPLALLATRWMRREVGVWATSALVVVGALGSAPTSAWVAAGLAAATLLLRAWRAPSHRAAPAHEAPRPPYRGASVEPPALAATLRFVPAHPSARARLSAGAIFAGYLAIGLFGHDRPSLPEPSVWLVVAVGVAALLAGLRQRRLVHATPIALAAAHLAVAREWIAAPRGAAEWGALSVVVGFASLAGALAVSWRLREGRPGGGRLRGRRLRARGGPGATPILPASGDQAGGGPTCSAR